MDNWLTVSLACLWFKFEKKLYRKLYRYANIEKIRNGFKKLRGANTIPSRSFTKEKQPEIKSDLAVDRVSRSTRSTTLRDDRWEAKANGLTILANTNSFSFYSILQIINRPK